MWVGEPKQMPDGGFERPVSEDVVQAAAARPGILTIVGLLMRVGVLRFSATLENRYFWPGTPKNDDFEVFISEWEGMHFQIMMIPEGKREWAERVAKECGLKLADGVPHAIDGADPKGGWKKFFLSGPRVWTLENVPGSPVYEATPEQIKAMLRQELVEAKAIIVREKERRGPCLN